MKTLSGWSWVRVRDGVRVRVGALRRTVAVDATAVEAVAGAGLGAVGAAGAAAAAAQETRITGQADVIAVLTQLRGGKGVEALCELLDMNNRRMGPASKTPKTCSGVTTTSGPSLAAP